MLCRPIVMRSMSSKPCSCFHCRTAISAEDWSHAAIYHAQRSEFWLKVGFINTGVSIVLWLALIWVVFW